MMNSRSMIGKYISVILMMVFVGMVSVGVSAEDGAKVVTAVKSGLWSDAGIWSTKQVPGDGDQVMIRGDAHVVYDVKSKAVLRSVLVSGHLKFATDKDTELNVGVLKVQPLSTKAGGVEDVDKHDHHGGEPMRISSSLMVGTKKEPIGKGHVAKIRLHYFKGMNKENEPAIIARPGGKMSFHGQPMSRTWVKLGKQQL